LPSGSVIAVTSPGWLVFPYVYAVVCVAKVVVPSELSSGVETLIKLPCPWESYVLVVVTPLPSVVVSGSLRLL
jgi:hypothetical protein